MRAQSKTTSIPIAPHMEAGLSLLHSVNTVYSPSISLSGWNQSVVNSLKKIGYINFTS